MYIIFTPSKLKIALDPYRRPKEGEWGLSLNVAVVRRTGSLDIYLKVEVPLINLGSQEFFIIFSPRGEFPFLPIVSHPCVLQKWGGGTKRRSICPVSFILALKFSEYTNHPCIIARGWLYQTSYYLSSCLSISPKTIRLYKLTIRHRQRSTLAIKVHWFRRIPTE